MLVTGNATLYVNADFATSGTSYIYVAPGASLKIYVAGTFNVGGTGIVNGSSLSSNLGIYALSTSAQNWVYGGSAAFIGSINAPNANFNFGGTAGLFGSLSANTVIIDGGVNVHDDESLSGGTNNDYVAASWIEI